MFFIFPVKVFFGGGGFGSQTPCLCKSSYTAASPLVLNPNQELPHQGNTISSCLSVGSFITHRTEVLKKTVLFMVNKLPCGRCHRKIIRGGLGGGREVKESQLACILEQKPLCRRLLFITVPESTREPDAQLRHRCGMGRANRNFCFLISFKIICCRESLRRAAIQTEYINK